jgi:hypothetical protein
LKRRSGAMAPDPTRKSRTAGASMSFRAGKTRFRRRMRTVGEIYEELKAILDALPLPRQEELERALSPEYPLTSDLHFLGALHGVLFLLSEAMLLAGEEERFAKSNAASFLVNDRVFKGLENVGLRIRRSPTEEAEHTGESLTTSESVASYRPGPAPLPQAALARDEPVVSFAAGQTPRAFSVEPRGLAMLVAVVRERVAEQGGCILDLQEFGLSPETACKVARIGRLAVSVGMKAVFVPGEEEADALQGEREP